MPKVPRFNSNEYLINRSDFDSKYVNSINQKYEDAKIFEIYNAINQWCQDNLYDSTNGYFAKSGKEAIEQYDGLNDSFEECISDLKNENHLSKESLILLDRIINVKKEIIFKNIELYRQNQVIEWANSCANTSLENSIINFVEARNSDIEMSQCKKTILSILNWIKINNNLNEEEFELLENNTLSKMHCAIIDEYDREGSLKAIEYFNNNKFEINEILREQYVFKIHNLKFHYDADTLSNKIINSYTCFSDTLPEINNIKDRELKEYVKLNVKNYFNKLENDIKLENKNKLSDFYSRYNILSNQNKTMSYSDIPMFSNNDIKLSLMNFINKNGSPTTDTAIFYELYKTMFENVTEFKNLNLDELRGYLEPDVYNLFLHKQLALNKSFASIQIKDDKKIIDNALSIIGINNSIPDEFFRIKDRVREYEIHSDSAISDYDLKLIIKNEGFKSSYIDKYKLIEDELNNRMEFIISILNEFEVDQNDNKLSFDDKEKIVFSRVDNYKRNS